MTSKAFANATDANRQQGGRRNLIINGAMQVAQRGTSSTASGITTVDRFEVQRLNTDQLATTQTQSTDAPNGFSNSLKVDVTTAETSIDADDLTRFRYKIEAQDLQHLSYGTSDAKTLVLSFWVKSSTTGTYAVSFYTPDSNMVIGDTYTIATANTWEQKTITVDALDTSSGIANDNGSGLEISWGLIVGSNWTGTDNTTWSPFVASKLLDGHTATWGTSASDEFYLTGVQLEVGSVATPFEHISYGESLAACQRYFYKSYPDGRYAGFNTENDVREGACITRNQDGNGRSANHWPFRYPVTMRAKPTLTVYSLNGTSGSVSELNGSLDHSSNLALAYFYDTDHQGGWQVVATLTALPSLAFGGFHVYANAEL